MNSSDYGTIEDDSSVSKKKFHPDLLKQASTGHAWPFTFLIHICIGLHYTYIGVYSMKFSFKSYPENPILIKIFYFGQRPKWLLYENVTDYYKTIFGLPPKRTKPYVKIGYYSPGLITFLYIGVHRATKYTRLGHKDNIR